MMMHRSLVTLVTLTVVCLLVLNVDACKVSSKTYSAQDGLVLTSVAHTISFTADCPPNGKEEGHKLASVFNF